MTRQELDLQSANDSTEQRQKPSELFNEFASYTTLHGFHFVLGSSSVIRRVVWAVLLLGGVALMACQFYVGYQKLVMRDSINVKQLQFDKDIVFPAVTICNQNMLRRSKVLRTPEVQTFMDDIESILFHEDVKLDSNETFALNLDEVVKEAGHNISAMLELCYWQGKRCGPNDFSLLISFQRGLCYTFNSGKPGYPIRYPKSAGRTQGLLLQLDAESDQYYGPFNLLDGTGFRVLVHDQSDWPDMENNAIDISPGFSCIIQVQRQKILRLPAPYKSNCGKRNLMAFESYSQSACFLECWTRHIIEKCRCRTLGMAQIDFNVSQYCGPGEIAKCVKTSQGTFSTGVDCDCPLECEKVHYDMKLSSSSFPSKHMLPIIIRRRNASQVNQTEELISKVQTELRKRLLQLNIFYQSTATEVTKEKPAYDIYDFASDLGGNMGLFMGCSVLTIFEFVDLFFLICLGSCNCRRTAHVRS